MIKDTQEYLQYWEKENNPFYPKEMRWDRAKVSRFLKDYKTQLEPDLTTKIQYIVKIIDTYGSFNMVDMEAETSVLVNFIGPNITQLANEFYVHGMDVTTYIHETATDHDFMDYEECDSDVIDDIVTLIEQYEASCLQTEKRINN